MIIRIFINITFDYSIGPSMKQRNSSLSEVRINSLVEQPFPLRYSFNQKTNSSIIRSNIFERPFEAMEEEMKLEIFERNLKEAFQIMLDKAVDCITKKIEKVFEDVLFTKFQALEQTITMKDVGITSEGVETDNKAIRLMIQDLLKRIPILAQRQGEDNCEPIVKPEHLVTNDIDWKQQPENLQIQTPFAEEIQIQNQVGQQSNQSEVQNVEDVTIQLHGQIEENQRHHENSRDAQQNPNENNQTEVENQNAIEDDSQIKYSLQEPIQEDPQNLDMSARLTSQGDLETEKDNQPQQVQDALSQLAEENKSNSIQELNKQSENIAQGKRGSFKQEHPQLAVSQNQAEPQISVAIIVPGNIAPADKETILDQSLEQDHYKDDASIREVNKDGGVSRYSTSNTTRQVPDDQHESIFNQ
ncbi:hypothetical protein FGO68_gene7923 [Halteria grandinella]|uniref:Uncharacterized protein n=1 Tax=Halteria grandinella TaxID=5974 RepID=A0A8J8NQ58_HALGN|nr:hypothetical protein FGO68_gene7923 [Halteria grandinella]